MHRSHVARLALSVALAAPLAGAAAQTSSWPSEHQGGIWFTTSAEQELNAKYALWFDGSIRRMGLGAEPMQVLLRPGVIRTIMPGVRVGAGYTYAATAPYGEVPAATPTREHRLWQDIRFASTIGKTAFTHRYRFEERWLAPVVGGETGEFLYNQRFRYMVRAQRPFGARKFRDRPVLVYLQEEAMLPLGHGGAFGRITQNRFQAGLGLPLNAHQRVDIGYLNLWNALPGPAVNEVNHIFSINWVVNRPRKE